MRYICTLKKDLPKYNKGTVFICKTYPNDHYSPYIGLNGEDCLRSRHELEYLIFNKEWFDVVPDHEHLIETKCKQCGGTQFDIFLTNSKSQWDDGVRYYSKEVVCECPCGYRFSLGRFGTHSELED